MENVEAAMRNMVKNIERQDKMERYYRIYKLLSANKVEEVRDYLKPEDAGVFDLIQYAKSPEMIKVIVNNMKHLNKTRKRAILKGYIFDPIRDRDPEMLQFFLETEPSLVNDLDYYNRTTLDAIARQEPTAATRKIIELLLRYGANTTTLKALSDRESLFHRSNIEEHIKFINEVLAIKKIAKLRKIAVSRREALTPPDLNNNGNPRLNINGNPDLGGKAYQALVAKWKGSFPTNHSGTRSPKRSGTRSGTRSRTRSGTRSPKRSGTRSGTRSPKRNKSNNRNGT